MTAFRPQSALNEGSLELSVSRFLLVQVGTMQVSNRQFAPSYNTQMSRPPLQPLPTAQLPPRSRFIASNGSQLQTTNTFPTKLCSTLMRPRIASGPRERRAHMVPSVDRPYISTGHLRVPSDIYVSRTNTARYVRGPNRLNYVSAMLTNPFDDIQRTYWLTSQTFGAVRSSSTVPDPHKTVVTRKPISLRFAPPWH